MRGLHRIAAFAFAVVALAAPAPASRAESRPVDLVVIVSAGNTQTPSAAALESIFLRKVVTWPSGERIIPLNATPDSERRQRFDRVALGMSPDEAARYWLDQRIRGGDSAPREVGDVVLTAKLVAKLPGTIGYVPADIPLAGVRVIARIHDDKVVPP
jgi:hypothetical protein